METFQTIIDAHPAHWDIHAYQDGWNAAEDAIATDYPSIDYPTGLSLAGSALAMANSIDRDRYPIQYYRELGTAARWLAATQRPRNNA